MGHLRWGVSNTSRTRRSHNTEKSAWGRGYITSKVAIVKTCPSLLDACARTIVINSRGKFWTTSLQLGDKVQMPVRLGSSSECENVTDVQVQGRSARPKRPSSGRAGDESDSLVLARKPSKRRRKANGLDHKLTRMLHRANTSYATMQALASQGKRARTISNGSSSSTSYEVPRTPVDDVHDAVVSQQGRIGQGFRLIKLDPSSSEQHPQAFEDVFTDSGLPSWKKLRKGQDDSRKDVNETNANPLPSWLSSTFSKLSSNHPLRSLVEADSANSSLVENANNLATNRLEYAPTRVHIPEEESIFAFRPPSAVPQPTAHDLGTLEEHKVPDAHPFVQDDPQPFSAPGPVYQADAYSLDFSNAHVRHSTPRGPPPYVPRARPTDNHPQTPKPFSTPGPAASFTVSPPPSRTRLLRFDVPDSDMTVFDRTPASPRLRPTANFASSSTADPHILTAKPNLPELAPYPAIEEEHAFEYQDTSHFDPDFNFELVEAIQPESVHSESILTLSPTPNVRTAPCKTISPISNKENGQGDLDDWLFSAEALDAEPAWLEVQEDPQAFLDDLGDSEPETNDNSTLVMYDPGEIPMTQTPIRQTPAIQKKPRLPFNPAPGIYISPGSSTSSSSLPTKVDLGSDPFITEGDVAKAPMQSDSDGGQSHAGENGQPERRRPKFRPAIIPDDVGRRQEPKLIGKSTEVKNTTETELAKTPLKEEVEKFINLFGSEEQMSQLTNDTIESWD
ncbi:hypothetical protein SCHPADRAFT_896608 [Schizopora paradoxa]|uniref:Uncharacterized protein n=1 Tax=Schizopora paradoxa TaxID=27342 RepID=A0A0H2R015_9AGAM|nr:hypothetical protein SCHPADRAFT_896608 [Schizopora paradoxa]